MNSNSSSTTPQINSTSGATDGELPYISYFLAVYITWIVAFVVIYCLISKHRTDIQQFVVLLLSGLSNVFTGIILFHVNQWTEFKEVNGLLILVQPLMGLKGNLEMTMASRMCTAMNVREDLVSVKVIGKEMFDDLILVQSQATVIAFVTSSIAIIGLAIDPESGFDWNNAVRIVAICLLTANIACLLLGIVISSIIIICKSLDYDPDDFATPIAASIGDLGTLVIMVIIVVLMVKIRRKDEFPYEMLGSIVAIIFVEPILLIISYRNPKTRSILVHGWTPIIIASLISSLSGIIFTHSTRRFPKLATFQPLFNGFAGNCVALLSSRLSTSLHRMGKCGTTDANFTTCVSPYYAFCSTDNKNARTTVILLIIVVPSQVLYLLITAVVQNQTEFQLTFPFLFFYLLFSLVQISLLLYFTYNLNHLIWNLKYDPDNYAIPILTATADITGTVILLLIFYILLALNDINSIKSF